MTRELNWTPTSDHSHRRFYGIFVRKERWSLWWPARLIVLPSILLTSTTLLFYVYPFLAVTHRVNTNVLVVEGWIHEFAIRAAVQEFRSGSYERVSSTGGPVEQTGGYINDYFTSASVGAESLNADGVPGKSLEMVPQRVMDRDRTYSSAVALRTCLDVHKVPVQAINVVTEDAHARRTRLLFQEAFGKTVLVGIIAVPNPDYDAKHWWRYSEGVKDVAAESVAYLYAKCFFWPSQSNAEMLKSQTLT